MCIIYCFIKFCYLIDVISKRFICEAKTLYILYCQVLQREGFTGMEDITKHIPGSVHADVRLKTPGKGMLSF